jgi:hypothetical protein
MPDTSNQIKSALGKWPGLFTRLCLTFHLIEIADAVARGAPMVPSAVVSAAVAARVASYMQNILLPHLLRAHAVMFSTVQTGHAQWIAGHILAKGAAQIAVRDIVQAYRALKAPEQRKELLEVMGSLESVGWVRPTPTTSNNPSRWDVNPRVHELFTKQADAERAARDEIKRRIAETVARFRDQTEPPGEL